ncbi:MAG: NAD-dependent deacylase [Bacteroidetes bacterium]|nr:MAG: NAD-dependent deacylase [Bacteroidota bacterium]
MNTKPKLVVFSGAGMSAESGISTFRDSGGLWEQYRIEEVATPEAWSRNPDLVTDFYNQRRKAIIEAQPNSGHIAIAELEKHFDVQVITQNIDDLHERAGSTSVLHLHGNIRLAKSSGPDQEEAYFNIEGWELQENDLSPSGYRLRPHVVWFGEAVPAYDTAVDILSDCSVLLVVGTSLQVYPAAGLIHYAPLESQKFIIDPNTEELPVPKGFNKINSQVGEGISQFIEMIF